MKRASLKFLILLTVVMSILCQVINVSGEGVLGYTYSKSLTVDYFTIANAYDDLQFTCVDDDYIYILNNTSFQKISLETSLVVDQIDYLLLTEPFELMRKGNRIYFDATIDALRTVVCIDITTFTELAQIPRSEFTPNFLRGLENIEYYNCSNHDFWVWGYAIATTGNDQRTYPNVFRGRYIYNPLGLNLDMQWNLIMGHVHMGVPTSGNVYVVQYMYNATSDSVSNFTWDTGLGVQNNAYWFSADSYFNDVNNTWTSGSALTTEQERRLGANYDDLMNLQYEFRSNEKWLDVTWGEYGVRDNPNVDNDPSYPNYKDYQTVWLDTDDRVLRHVFYSPTTINNYFAIARFDYGVGFITWIGQYYQNKTNMWDSYPNEEHWGRLALGRYEHYYYGERSWVAYCNMTDNYPKAEFATETGGVTCYEAGTIEFEYDNVTDSRVYMARKNFIAIFTIGSDNDNLYVCRNLIDRNVLLGNGYITPTLSFQNATMYESDGVTVKVQPYLFMGELYYLEADVSNMTYFYLEMDDGLNTIYLNYTNATRTLNIECDEFVAGLVSGTVTAINATAERYSLRWGFILNKNILDVPINFNVTYYGYNVHEDTDITGVAVTGLRIYNLGGHVAYEMQGDGGRITGGDWLEIHQTNGTGATTGAYAETIYRRLQHVHVLWSLDASDNACFDDDEDTGYVYMGIRYMTSAGVWVDGWYMRVRIDKGAVDPASKAWITNRVQWYARDENGAVSLIGTSQYLSGYPECGDTVGADITRTRFYTDLWFNTANSSTTVGGRLNTYYFGMENSGFLLWSTWNPIMLNMSESMMFTDLRDSSGDIINSQEIELMKFWVRVLKVSDATCDSHTWSIRSPQISYQLAGDRMHSLNTPDGVETIIIDMPSTGWLQPIAKAISSIGNVIWSGAFNFIKVLIGGFDSLLTIIGSPVSMSQMIEWIMIQASYITAWMVYVVDYVSSMLSVFSGMITVLTSVMTWAVNAVIWVLTYVVGFPIAMLTFFVQIISGQSTVTYYEWTFDFSSVSGLIEGAKTIAPIGIGIMYISWIFWGNIEMKGDVDETGVISRIMATFGWFRVVYNDLFWVFNRMRNEIISLYNFIRSHIPSLGGGGGEVEE